MTKRIEEEPDTHKPPTPGPAEKKAAAAAASDAKADAKVLDKAEKNEHQYRAGGRLIGHVQALERLQKKFGMRASDAELILGMFSDKAGEAVTEALLA